MEEKMVDSSEFLINPMTTLYVIMQGKNPVSGFIIP
jgi:hypothetical protein